MLYCVEGNVLDAGLEAIVNPCNTRGAYGRGLSAEIMNRYSYIGPAYVAHVRLGNLVHGGDLATSLTSNNGPVIVHIATKEDWRNPSQYRWVERGLANLHAWMSQGHAKNVGLIPLGAGLGGLDGKTVLNLTRLVFDNEEDPFDVYYFLPR